LLDPKKKLRGAFALRLICHPSLLRKIQQRCSQHKIGVRLTAAFLLFFCLLSLGGLVAFWQLKQVNGEVQTLADVDSQTLAILRVYNDILNTQDHLRRSAPDLITEFPAEISALSETVARDLNSAIAVVKVNRRTDSMTLVLLQYLQATIRVQLHSLILMAQTGDADAIRERLSSQLSQISRTMIDLTRELDAEASAQRGKVSKVLRQFVIEPPQLFYSPVSSACLGLQSSASPSFAESYSP
jgi:hypothetical protein